jgi:hypothetical protein
VKYISIQVAIASINTKFSKFPTPKNNKIENNVSDIEETSPRRELAKRRENVKRMATNKVMKKSGTTPKVFGSTK